MWYKKMVYSFSMEVFSCLMRKTLAISLGWPLRHPTEAKRQVLLLTWWLKRGAEEVVGLPTGKQKDVASPSLREALDVQSDRLPEGNETSSQVELRHCVGGGANSTSEKPFDSDNVTPRQSWRFSM